MQNIIIASIAILFYGTSIAQTSTLELLGKNPDEVGENYALNMHAKPSPNDGNAVLHLFAPDAGTATMLIYAANGEKVLEEKNIPLSQGNNNIPISMINPKSGIYSVVMVIGKNKLATKFVVAK